MTALRRQSRLQCVLELLLLMSAVLALVATVIASIGDVIREPGVPTLASELESENWSVQEKENVSEEEAPLQASNGLRRAGKQVMNAIVRAYVWVRNVVSNANDILSRLQNLPVVGDVIRTVSSFVQLIKAIVKLFKFIINGGVPGRNYLLHLYQGFQKLFNSYKSDRRLSCLYTHIFKLESLSFNLGFPFGMSMECTSDWNCFKCVGHILSSGHRMLFDFLTVMISALTGSQAEEALSRLESVSTMQEVEYNLQLMQSESMYSKDSEGDDYRLSHMLAISKTPSADQFLENVEEEEAQKVLEHSFTEDIYEYWEEEVKMNNQGLGEEDDDFPTLFLPSKMTPFQEEMFVEAGNFFGTVRDFLKNVRDWISGAWERITSIPGLGPLMKGLRSMSRAFEEVVKKLLNPEELINMLSPSGFLQDVSRQMQRIPCLKKELEEGGIAFGLGVDNSGPSVEVTCNRLSCFACLAKSALRMAPFSGFPEKVVQFIFNMFDKHAAQAAQEYVSEVQNLQETAGLQMEEQVEIHSQFVEEALNVQILEIPDDVEISAEEEATLLNSVLTEIAHEIGAPEDEELEGAEAGNRVRNFIRKVFLINKMETGLRNIRASIVRTAKSVWNALKTFAKWGLFVLRTLVGYLKNTVRNIITKVFSALDFAGSFIQKALSSVHQALKKYGGCIYEEIDAMNASGGKSVGLSLTVGLDLKITPSFGMSCNRGSCYYCMSTLASSTMQGVAQGAQDGIGIGQQEIRENMEIAAQLEKEIFFEEEDEEDMYMQMVEELPLFQDTTPLVNLQEAQVDFSRFGDELSYKIESLTLEGATAKAAIFRRIANFFSEACKAIVRGFARSVRWIVDKITALPRLVRRVWDGLKKLNPANLWKWIKGKWNSLTEGIRNLDFAKIIEVVGNANIVSLVFEGVYKLYRVLPEDSCVRLAIDGGYITGDISFGAPPSLAVGGNIFIVARCMSGAEAQWFMRQMTSLFDRALKTFLNDGNPTRPLAEVREETRTADGKRDNSAKQSSAGENTSDEIKTAALHLEEEMCENFQGESLKVQGLKLNIPLIGEISFDVDEARVDVGLTVKVFRKPASLKIKVYQEGTSMGLHIPGPYRFSDMLLGRSVDSPVVKILDTVGVRDVHVEAKFHRSLLCLIKKRISMDTFSERMTISMKGTMDFGKETIQGLPAIGSVSFAGSMDPENGISYSIEVSNWMETRLAFIPGTSVSLQQARLEISLSRIAVDPHYEEYPPAVPPSDDDEELKPDEDPQHQEDEIFLFLRTLPPSAVNVLEQHGLMAELKRIAGEKGSAEARARALEKLCEKLPKRVYELLQKAGFIGQLKKIIARIRHSAARDTSSSSPSPSSNTNQEESTDEEEVPHDVEISERHSRATQALVRFFGGGKSAEDYDLRMCVRAKAEVTLPLFGHLKIDNFEACLEPASGKLDIEAVVKSAIQVHQQLKLTGLMVQAYIERVQEQRFGFTVAGNAEILGLPMATAFTYQSDKTYVLDAFPENDDPLDLRERLPFLKKLGNFGAIVLEDYAVSGTLTPDRKLFFDISGSAMIAGIRVMAQVAYGHQDGGVSKTVRALVQTGGNTTLSGTFLNFFKDCIDSAALVITDENHHDSFLGRDVPAGVSFAAILKPSGIMNNIVSAISKVTRRPVEEFRLELFTSIPSDNPRNAEFRIVLPAFPRNMFRSKRLWPGHLALIVSAKGSFGFETSIYAKFDASELRFLARFELDPVSFKITAAMQGTWRNPIGLKNFAIGDLALTCSINIQSGIPIGLGFTGRMEFGTRELRFALALDVTSGGVIVSGSLSKLAIKDFFLVASKLGAPLKESFMEKIPHIAMEDFKIQVASKAMKLGPFEFEQGIHLAGKLTILDKSIVADVRVNTAGFSIYGELPEIKLGPIRIYRPNDIGGQPMSRTPEEIRKLNAVPDLEALKKVDVATRPHPSNGPVLRVEMTSKEQSLYLIAGLTLWKVNLKVNLYLTKDEMHFQASLKLGSLLDVAVHVRGLLSNQAFLIQARLQSSFNTIVRKEVDRAIAAGLRQIENSQKSIAESKASAYAKIEARVLNRKDRIKKLKKKIANLKRQLVLQAVAQNSEELVEQSEEHDSEDLKSMIEEMESLEAAAFLKAIGRAAKKTAKRARISLQIAALGIEIARLRTANFADEKVLKGAISFGSGILKGVLKIVSTVMKGVNTAVQKLLKTLVFKEAGFTCSWEDRRADGYLHLSLFGGKVKLKFVLDFSSPSAFLKSLASGISKSILGHKSVKDSLQSPSLYMDVEPYLLEEGLSVEQLASLKEDITAFQDDSLRAPGVLPIA